MEPLSSYGFSRDLPIRSLRQESFCLRQAGSSSYSENASSIFFYPISILDYTGSEENPITIDLPAGAVDEEIETPYLTLRTINDVTPAYRWSPNTAYNIGDRIVESTRTPLSASSFKTGYRWVCVTAGVSGNNEPNWSSSNIDGTVIWNRSWQPETWADIDSARYLIIFPYYFNVSDYPSFDFGISRSYAVTVDEDINLNIKISAISGEGEEDLFDINYEVDVHYPFPRSISSAVVSKSIPIFYSDKKPYPFGIKYKITGNINIPAGSFIRVSCPYPRRVLWYPLTYGSIALPDIKLP